MIRNRRRRKKKRKPKKLSTRSLRRKDTGNKSNQLGVELSSSVHSGAMPIQTNAFVVQTDPFI